MPTDPAQVAAQGRPGGPLGSRPAPAPGTKPTVHAPAGMAPGAPQHAPGLPAYSSSYAPLPAMPNFSPPALPGAGLAPQSPYEDPQYLAFLRASGQSEADLRAQNALQTSMIQRGAERQLPGLREGIAAQLRDIGLGATARGTFGSGTRAMDQNRVAVAGTRAEQDIMGSANEQIAMMQLDLARQLAGIHRNTAEEDVDARQRLALGAAGIGAL